MSKTLQMEVLELRRGGRDIRELIREAIERTGSMSEAAADLGITRVCLYDWIDRLGGSVTQARQVTVRFDDAEMVAAA